MNLKKTALTTRQVLVTMIAFKAKVVVVVHVHGICMIQKEFDSTPLTSFSFTGVWENNDRLAMNHVSLVGGVSIIDWEKIQVNHHYFDLMHMTSLVLSSSPMCILIHDRVWGHSWGFLLFLLFRAC